MTHFWVSESIFQCGYFFGTRLIMRVKLPSFFLSDCSLAASHYLMCSLSSHRDKWCW